MKGLVLTYAITAVGSFTALRRPLIGLYIYIGFAVLRPQFLFGWAGDMSYLSLVVGAAALAGWALNGFGSWNLGPSRGIVAAILAYSGWYAVSAVTAVDQARAFSAVVELAKTLLPLLMGITLIDSRTKLRPLIWVIVIAQGYVAFEMNWSYLRGYNQAAFGFGGMDNNFFAVTLVTVLSLAFTLAIVTERWYERAAAAAAGLLILHTILLTFSRGAMVGLLATGAMALVLIPKRPANLAVMLAVLLISMRLVGPQLAERYSTTFVSADERDGSAESRVDLWMDCLRVVEQYPVLGVGPWNWPVIASSFGWPEGKSAHSLWMESAAEVGIPGALLLLTFFSLGVAKLWPVARAKWTGPERLDAGIATGIALCLVGFAVSAQFVSVSGLEVPYYVTMVGAVLLKVRGMEPVGTAIQVQVEKAALAGVPVLPRRPATTDRPRLLPILPERTG